MAETRAEKVPVATVYVVSGGAGTSGQQLVNTALAQFVGARARVLTHAHVRTPAQVESVLADAADRGALVVHTLVDAQLRAVLEAAAAAHGVVALDLLGHLLDVLAVVLGQAPVGQPGLYWRLHHDYFRRVAAIEYTLAHDDGQRPAGWGEADLVLVGVSRTGKTPLSVYLSILGWQVANVPVVPGVALPPELGRLPRERVIGLTIAADRLLGYRQQRGSRLGVAGGSAYADLVRIEEELAVAREVCRRGGFRVVDVTDKTIEASADDLLRLMRREGASAPPGGPVT